MKKNNLCIKICLIDPMTEDGYYKPETAPIKDYIVVSFYGLGFIFLKVLVESLELLLRRNNILPED